MAKDTDLE